MMNYALMLVTAQAIDGKTKEARNLTDQEYPVVFETTSLEGFDYDLDLLDYPTAPIILNTNVAFTDGKVFTQETTLNIDSVDYVFKTAHVYDGSKDSFSVTTNYASGSTACTYDWTIDKITEGR